MPIPNRSRNKDGKWRKKRSDAGKPRGQYNMPLMSSEPMQPVRAGPPVCDKCGSPMDLYEKYKGCGEWVWICPNFCNIQKPEDNKDA